MERTRGIARFDGPPPEPAIRISVPLATSPRLSTLFGVTPEEEIRLELLLHYDGSRFYGWQIQPDRRTVQGVLQAATEQLTGSARTVTGSGRTDRGVHATGQVASLTVPASWTPASFRKAMNAVLPEEIWVEATNRVSPDFHPRHDAVGRTYRYRLGLAEDAWSPFVRPFCWPVEDPVDRDLLERAAETIPGERSFDAFAKAGQPERGTRCRVRRAEWSPWRDKDLAFTITSNRFLHHMVRYLVGTMVAVATGRRPLSELEALLEGGPTDELWTSPPAPAEGLFLHRVEYPEEALRSAPRTETAWSAEE